MSETTELNRLLFGCDRICPRSRWRALRRVVRLLRSRDPIRDVSQAEATWLVLRDSGIGMAFRGALWLLIGPGDPLCHPAIVRLFHWRLSGRLFIFPRGAGPDPMDLAALKHWLSRP